MNAMAARARVLLAILLLGLVAAGCGDGEGGQTSKLACQATVDAVQALKQDLDLPKNLQVEGAAKQGGEFDPNLYFTALTHLSAEPGYVLDYVYYYDGFGGMPRLYGRPEGMAPYRTYDDYAAAGEAAVQAGVRTNYLDAVRADGTPDSFFELAVLRVVGPQFYLYWHSGYDDWRVVCGREGLERVFDQIEEWDFKMDADVRRQAQAMDLEPSVEIEGENVRVELVLFSKFGGFQRMVYTLSQSAPHQFVSEEPESEVPWNCGIVF